MRNLPTRMMRAVLVRKFGGVEQMNVEGNVPVPPIADSELLIKVYSSGVNPVDTYIRAGQYGRLPNLPYIPGRDGAGIVHDVGAAVTKFKIGDRVFFESSDNQNGTLAEYTSVNASNIYPLGNSLTFDEGAAICVPYFTAYRALVQKAKAKCGERLLIHGASGAVGLASIQIAKQLGLVVVGTAGTQEGRDTVLAAGADEVHNHHDSDYIFKLQHGDKFDIILEMLSNVNLGHDLTLMKVNGRTIVIGCRGRVDINPRDLMASEGSVIGCALALATAAERQEISDSIVEGVKSGWVKPTIDAVYELEKAGDAHDAIMNSGGAKGKLIVRVQE